MRPFPSLGGVPHKRRSPTVLLAVLFVAGIAASAFTAASPQPVAAAGKPAVVSAELNEKLAATPDSGVEAVITAHDHAGLDAIKRLGIDGTRLRVMPMLLVKDLTMAELRLLQRSPAVRSVYHNKRHTIQMEDSTWIVGARYTWGASAPTRFKSATDRPNGYSGRGVDIAVIDTGIDGGHDDTDNLVEFCDTTAAATGERALVACAGTPGAVDGQPIAPPFPANAPLTGARGAAFDDEGHGSHVSGTVAGSGDASGGIDDTHSTIGVAPEARLHVYSANLGPFLANFQILAAYDDMIFKKLNHDSGVMATSNSFGGGDGANYSPDDPQAVAHKTAYDAGIVSVYAAGNSGPEHDTLSDSCIDPWVVCVGATTKPDSVVQFSSRGRPSELADTNRNGIVGDDGTNGTPDDTGDDIAADVAPDNHDRKLGQRLALGVYRPTLVAPGVNTNSISANAAGCRESTGTGTSCYEPLNGTSMATPHVSGAVAVIVQAWRQQNGGADPSSAKIIDILERSAALHKLPGYEAEEQGAGRLNVWDAVRFIRGEISLPKPNFGTPSPVYASGKFPGAAATKNSFDGCTAPLSFTPISTNPIDEPADQPPEDAGRAKQHDIVVPTGAERLRVTVAWPEHPTANLYVRLWRPDVNPNDEFSSDFRRRAFPDQEAVGLTTIGTQRFLDVRAPEAGTWRLRVYHRIGGVPAACESTPSPAPVGYNYTVTTEIPISARVPTVAFSEPAGGSTHTDRVIVFRGTAGYPTRWDGVTNYEVPGTGIAAGGDVDDPREELHFQGNTEEGCSGDGFNDGPSGANICDGPFLLPKTMLSDSPAASWNVVNPLLTFNTERDGGVPNWIWDLPSETTLRGPMTVEWWGSCGTCGPTIGSADWILRIYADGEQAFEERVTATPSGPDEITLLSATVDLPTITASDRIVLHIEPVYIDSQNNSAIHYDSKMACSGETGGPACDSTVLMPVVDPTSAAPQQAENLRVTDIHTGLRLAWDPAPGATGYEIHRSAQPDFTPSSATRIASVTGTSCASPSVPTWPSASDTGARCFTDSSVAELKPFYYRVVAKDGAVLADPSLLAYGTRTVFDRQVKIKGDRLYGPGLWGYARLIGTDATRWRYSFDTLERPEGTATDPNLERVSARSFTQGIGSANKNRTVETEGPAPETPFDPVVIFTKQGPLTARAGDTITYTLQYENLGPAPSSNARVVDTLPAGMRFVSASGGGVFDAGKNIVKWNLGTVADGSGGTLTIRLKIRGSTPDGAVVVNEARFRADLTFATPTGVAQTTILP